GRFSTGRALSMQRRWLILTGVIVLAIGGGVAAAVVLVTGGGKKSSQATPTLRVALPAAERIGGFFPRAAAAPGARGAQASTAGAPQISLGGELENELADAYALRAYPATRVTAQRAQVSRASFQALPLRLTGSQPNVTSRLGLTSQWELLGPTRALESP